MKRVIERTKPKQHILESMIVGHFKDYPDDDKAIISIERDLLTRSGAQNKLLWMWNKIIGDEIGHIKEDMHDMLVRKLLGEVEYKDFNGNIKTRAIETKKLKVGEMKDYLEALDMFSAEWGIILPRPEDLWWKSMGIKRG